MKTYVCFCGARIFFRNSRCLSCSRELGFLPDCLQMTAIEPLSADGGANEYQALAVQAPYRKCRNYSGEDVCNWLLPAADPEELCSSCRLSRVIPDLTVPDNHERWARAEAAKRQLLYTLMQLRLPIISREHDPEAGLVFEFKSPAAGEPVLTGHADGVITLNMEEADPVAREEMRVNMRERYRTLLGHFRHEIGHYYWTRLIEHDPGRLERFRALFGDEREDYGEALQRHYAKAANDDWRESYISAYASAHPWEDWAETWAHYLHMVDTFETAQHFGLVSQSRRLSLGDDKAVFERVMAEWLDLTIALNALNRSMGLADPYPFEVGPVPAKKLAFVHEVIGENRRQQAAQPLKKAEPRPPTP